MATYEIRNMPDRIARELVRVAEERDLSPEQAAVELIAERLGITDVEFEYYDLEDLEVAWPEETEAAHHPVR
jgi:hypothetical protein